MDGKQYIYSLQLGLSYKITDWLSAFAGGRMNYFSGNYDGYLDAKLKQNFGGADLMNLALDCDQTADDPGRGDRAERRRGERSVGSVWIHWRAEGI